MRLIMLFIEIICFQGIFRPGSMVSQRELLRNSRIPLNPMRGSAEAVGG